MPDTLDEIDAMLNEEKARAECFTGLSDNVRQTQHIFTIIDEAVDALLNSQKHLQLTLSDKFQTPT